MYLPKNWQHDIPAQLYLESYDDSTELHSILPRSKEAQEAMIEAGAKAIAKLAWDPEFTRNPRVTGHNRKQSRAVLASANLVEKE